MMVKVEDISSVKKKLSFEVPAEKVDAEIEKAYQKIGKSAKVKGFREGKVPRTVLERFYAPQMEEQVIGRLINESYFKALQEHDIFAINDPQIIDNSELQKGAAFTYEAHVEVKPELVVKDYTGLSLQKEKWAFDEKVIEERLEQMQSDRAEKQPVTRDKAKGGDFVVLDFEGFVDGVAFDGGKAEGYELELGSGSFIPGFEEQLVGMACGEEKDVEVSFPEQYGNAELAGKPATFKVKIHEIKEKVLPPADDEFAKGFGVDTLEELKGMLRTNHETQETNRIDGDLRERLMRELIARNPMEVPETMVERQLKYMLENLANRMKSQGMSLEMLGMTPESFGQMYRDNAVDQVKGSLILEAVAQQEKITAAEEDIDGKLEEIAKMANAPLDAVKRHYASPEARRGLLSQIAEEKVIKFLLDNATVEEVAKEELSEDEDETNDEKE